MGRWLTDELDMVPFSYDKVQLDEVIKKIEDKKVKIDRYLEVHPKAKAYVFTDENRNKRFIDNALSYFALEQGDAIDIIPSVDKSHGENTKEFSDMKKVVAYKNACEMMHNSALDPNCYLDDQLLIRAHSLLYEGDPESRNFVRYRFRNQTDPTILMGQGYFNPLQGEWVAMRVGALLYNLSDTWSDEHPIIKGAKFVAEYFRIQPHLDGNKRTALMALNFILEKAGYPDIYIREDQSKELFKTLETAILDRDVTPLALLLAENVNIRYDRITDEIRDYRINGFEKITSTTDSL